MLSVQTLMQDAQVDLKKHTIKPSIGRKEERRLLTEAIDRLPEVARLVLGLRYHESVRPKAIAGILGVEEPEVRRLLSDAIAAVLEDLGRAVPASVVKPKAAGPSKSHQRKGCSR